jgi:hypothetical protein
MDTARRFSEDQNLLYSLKRSDKDEIMEFFTGFRDFMKREGEYPVVDLPVPGNEPYAAYFIGDTQGDLYTSIRLYKRFAYMKDRLTEKALEKGLGEIGVKLVYLGNYSGWTPRDLPFGGLMNMIFLFSLKITRPDEIYLLRGNQETRELREFEPHELIKELVKIFGINDAGHVLLKLNTCFSELPLFARTPNGVVAAHGGFPVDLSTPIEEIPPDLPPPILSTVWGDPQESGTYRGEISIDSNYNRYDFDRFLEWSGSNVLVRGNDPKVKGFALYDRKLLTVFSSSRYQDKGHGGVVVGRALVHDEKQVRSVDDMYLRELDEYTLIEDEIPDWKA